MRNPFHLISALSFFCLLSLLSAATHPRAHGSSSHLVHCLHGFEGRIKASNTPGYISISDRRMCAAHWCLKVIVYSSNETDGFGRQGVASRCAYTGGDRQLCYAARDRDAACTPTRNYNGMTGNFSICCCRHDQCNQALPSDFDFYEDEDGLDDDIKPSKLRRESAATGTASDDDAESYDENSSSSSSIATVILFNSLTYFTARSSSSLLRFT